MAGASETGTSGSAGASWIAAWLFVCAGMVFVAVVLGGVTRLTHAGLSIVDWEPVTGILPPFSAAEWEEAFGRYRESPEYLKVNLGMTLAEFRSIFWLEYVHRLWGRLIGVVFLLPFLYFLARGTIAKGLRLPLLGIFSLGAVQGALGWFMVASGLVDHPDVSPYRLTAHLALALVIYALLLRIGLRLLRPAGVETGGKGAATGERPGLRRLALAATLAVFATALSGGFVAGTDAGFLFNTFPLMDGEVLPPDAFRIAPWYRNFFENHALVQFDHRLLGILTFALVVVLWFAAQRRRPPPALALPLDFLLLAAVIQASLGIATLLTVVDVSLAASHQAGALVLFTFALWTNHELARGEPHPLGERTEPRGNRAP